jgi:hypothetical protein
VARPPRRSHHRRRPLRSAAPQRSPARATRTLTAQGGPGEELKTTQRRSAPFTIPDQSVHHERNAQRAGFCTSS